MEQTRSEIPHAFFFPTRKEFSRDPAIVDTLFSSAIIHTLSFLSFIVLWNHSVETCRSKRERIRGRLDCREEAVRSATAITTEDLVRRIVSKPTLQAMLLDLQSILKPCVFLILLSAATSTKQREKRRGRRRFPERTNASSSSISKWGSRDGVPHGHFSHRRFEFSSLWTFFP